jgi:hypothetical protein
VGERALRIRTGASLVGGDTAAAEVAIGVDAGISEGAEVVRAYVEAVPRAHVCVPRMRRGISVAYAGDRAAVAGDLPPADGAHAHQSFVLMGVECSAVKSSHELAGLRVQ